MSGALHANADAIAACAGAVASHCPPLALVCQGPSHCPPLAPVCRALEGKSFFYDTTLPPKPAEAPGAVKQEQEPLAAPPAPPKSSLPLKKRTSE